MTPKQAQRLVGRTIVAVELNATWETDIGSHTRVKMHDPTITLDDGSRLRFVVEEHPSGDGYGVHPVHVRPKGRRRS